MRFAPLRVKVGNPEFDVAPAKYVTGIVTENGIAYPPFELSLKQVVKGKVLLDGLWILLARKPQFGF